MERVVMEKNYCGCVTCVCGASENALPDYSNNQLGLKVEKTSEFTGFGRSRELDAAFDLYATESVTILPGQIAKIAVGVKVEFNPGWVMVIHDRSGLAAKNGIKVLGGVIDCNYRGEINVLLTTLKSDREMPSYAIQKGDKIAQIIPIRISQESFEFVEKVSDNTERGENGFGSSGK
jgi:dUTP pyrophosphatase